MNLVADDFRVGSFEFQAAPRTDAPNPPLPGNAPGSEIRPEEERIAQLRQVLRAVAYPGSSVREVLGPEIGRAHLRVDLPLYLRRLRAPTKLNTLVKLFALGVRVSEAEARAALAPFALEDASALGLLECGPRGARPLVGISVCDNLFLIHDCHNDDAANLRSDYVLGVNPAALSLAHLTARRPVRSVLDIGTGCGIQALLAARHSERVVAVDTNPRALRFARMNARLNGLDNVDCWLGSLFGPVAGRRFDLIVCNPPYVISPETKYMFRDSGLPNDTICETVIREVHAYLNEGGLACLLCNWALKKNEPWEAPLQRWVQGQGCDAWFLHSATQDPLTYAAIWTRDRDASRYQQSLDEWASYYDQNGIEAIGLGAIILRRRSAKTNWQRKDELPTAPVASCSDWIQSVFQTEDYLATVDDDQALLPRKFRRSSDHQVWQNFTPRSGRYTLDEIELQWHRGFAFRAAIDAGTFQLLSRCDGAQTLGEIIAALENSTAASQINFRTGAAAIVRRLLALGLLVPVQ